MKRLNIEVVKDAIDELVIQGRKPTNQNIVNHLGYGSFSTLTILRKKHPAIFGVIPKYIVNTVQNTVNNTDVTVDIDVLWQRIEGRVEEKAQSVFLKYSTVQNDDVARELELKVKALESENELLKVQLDEKEDGEVARINDLEKERLELRDEVLNLRDNVEQLQAQIEDSQKEAQLISLLERNADLESKLEAIQKEAQNEKYTALKMDVADRKTVILDGEAEVEYIIDTGKAKKRVIELIKKGLDQKAVAQKLELEGYRTKNFLGDVKPYLSTNIGKWQRKFKQKGKI